MRLTQGLLDGFNAFVSLFWLVFAVKGLEEDGVLDALWEPVIRRGGFAALFWATVLFSALFTNDAALFLALPVALKRSERPELTAFGLALAANVGCVLLPWGSPQNLLIYRGYALHPLEFFRVALPVGAVGILLAAPFSFLGKARAASRPAEPRSRLLWGLSFAALAFGIVLHLPWWLLSLLMMPALFAKLRAFRNFPWAFLGVLGAALALGELLEPLLPVPTEAGFGIAALGFAFSQAVSNVPATALLLPHFPHAFPWLFLGVSAGGLGLPWASLANLIALGHLPRGRRLKGTLLFLLGLPLGLVWLGLGGLLLK